MITEGLSSLTRNSLAFRRADLGQVARPGGEARCPTEPSLPPGSSVLRNQAPHGAASIRAIPKS